MLKTILFVFLAVVGWRDCAWSQTKTTSGKNQVVYAQQFDPPIQYRYWYKQAEKCVGKHGDYSKIIWTMAKHPWNNDSAGNPHTYGLFAPSADSLHGVILLNVEDAANKLYVMHEEIHDILWRNGWHSPEDLAGVHDSVNVRRQHPVPPYEKCAPTYIQPMREWWQKEQARLNNPWKLTYKP